MRTLAAAAASGLLLALAFPPREWVLLLPLAPVVWLAALLSERSRGRALLSGVVFGLAYWCASIPWIVYVVTNFGGQKGIMGVVCLVLLALILAQWPAIVAWGAVAVAPAGSAWRMAAFPVLWWASEHARSYVYGGFPWNLTGTALYRHPMWIQTASIWGVYGVGFLAMAAAALLALAASRRRVAPAVAAAILATLVGVAGALLGRPEGDPTGPTVRAALLQPNLSQESRLDDTKDGETYAVVMGQAREAAAQGAELILFPESALPTYWDWSERLRADLMAIASPSRFVIFNDVEFAGADVHYNVARVAGPEGLVGAPYRKVHLVPFGEFVPLPRVFFFVRRIAAAIGEFSAADHPGLLTAGPSAIGMSVCYEVCYPLQPWKQTRSGANLLATISNDSWYGRAGAQAQHLAGGVLRAVENRRWLLRAAVTGISAAVDDRGRIVLEQPADTAGILYVEARLRTERSPWTRWSFAFSALADTLAVGMLLFGLRRWLAEWRTRKSLPRTEH
jgi:apolipoprotein N-acyltransferase